MLSIVLMNCTATDSAWLKRCKEVQHRNYQVWASWYKSTKVGLKSVSKIKEPCLIEKLELLNIFCLLLHSNLRKDFFSWNRHTYCRAQWHEGLKNLRSVYLVVRMWTVWRWARSWSEHSDAVHRPLSLFSFHGNWMGFPCYLGFT